MESSSLEVPNVEVQCMNATKSPEHLSVTLKAANETDKEICQNQNVITVEAESYPNQEGKSTAETSGACLSIYECVSGQNPFAEKRAADATETGEVESWMSLEKLADTIEDTGTVADYNSLIALLARLKDHAKCKRFQNADHIRISRKLLTAIYNEHDKSMNNVIHLIEKMEKSRYNMMLTFEALESFKAFKYSFINEDFCFTANFLNESSVEEVLSSVIAFKDLHIEVTGAEILLEKSLRERDDFFESCDIESADISNIVQHYFSSRDEESQSSAQQLSANQFKMAFKSAATLCNIFDQYFQTEEEEFAKCKKENKKQYKSAMDKTLDLSTDIPSSAERNLIKNSEVPRGINKDLRKIVNETNSPLLQIDEIKSTGGNLGMLKLDSASAGNQMSSGPSICKRPQIINDNANGNSVSNVNGKEFLMSLCKITKTVSVKEVTEKLSVVESLLKHVTPSAKCTEREKEQICESMKVVTKLYNLNVEIAEDVINLFKKICTSSQETKSANIKKRYVEKCMGRLKTIYNFYSKHHHRKSLNIYIMYRALHALLSVLLYQQICKTEYQQNLPHSTKDCIQSWLKTRKATVENIRKTVAAINRETFQCKSSKTLEESEKIDKDGKCKIKQ